jgi:hypothetical protein
MRKVEKNDTNIDESMQERTCHVNRKERSCAIAGNCGITGKKGDRLKFYKKKQEKMPEKREKKFF